MPAEPAFGRTQGNCHVIFAEVVNSAETAGQSSRWTMPLRPGAAGRPSLSPKPRGAANPAGITPAWRADVDAPVVGENKGGDEAGQFSV